MQAVDAPASPGAGPADSPNSSAMPAPSAQGALGGGPSGSSAPPSPAPRQARVPAALSQATGTGHSSSAPPLSPATTPDPPPVPSTSSSPLRSPSSPSPSPALPASQTHKRVLLRRPSSSASRAPQSDASPLPSTEARARNGSIGDIARRTSELALGEAADGSGESSQGPAGDGSVAPLDPVLHAALNHPRDRLLLLRAEVEMERFVASPSLTRLPLAPPHFQPSLNSYQRLLIHRLADTFGITREVEAAPPAMWNAGMINPATGQPQGVVVLVKSENSRAPAVKLATHVPAPEVAPPAAAPSGTPPTLPSRPSTPSVADSPAASITSSNPAPVAPPLFKILPRSAASRGASSAASSVVGEDDGVSSASTGTSARGSKGRRELTLLEREAAYKEARERIFSQPDIVTPPPPAPASVASSVAGGTNDDAQSVQSAGYGITRPSSAGSTLSRSSAALSISGQRPPPSLVSESSSAGIRTGYPGTGVSYYQHGLPPPLVHHQQQHQAPHYGMMRSTGPTFDPATGSWTYSQAGAPPPPPVHDYASSYPYGGTGYPHPANGAYAAYAPPPPHPASGAPYDPHGPPPPIPAAWSSSPASGRGLPSPALSSSSGGSSFPPFPPPSASSSSALPPPSQRVSSGASAAGSDGGAGAGYLMRFPEGAVVTPGGNVVGPPAPYAAIAAAGSSSSVAGGAAPFRRASGSSAGASAGVAHEARLASARRSPEASRAASLVAPSDAGSSSSAGRSDAASGSSDGRRRARQSTVVQSSREDGFPVSAAGGGGAAPARHPSLPAKPVWVASQPPPERPAPATAASVAPQTTPQLKSAQPLPPPAAPYASAGAGAGAGPPFLAGPPSQPPNGLSSGYHPHASGPPPPPPGAGPWMRSGAAPAALHPVAYGASAAEYPSLHAPVAMHSAPQHGYYASPGLPASVSQGWQHVAPPPAPGPGPALHGYAPPAAAVPPAGEGLLGLPEMRRPRPRNTQLFDPNKPAGGGGGAGGTQQGMGMRRGGSGAGQGRRG